MPILEGLNDVYGGLLYLPKRRCQGKKRIGQLDFNMPDPFILNGDKLAPEGSGSSLLCFSQNTCTLS